MQCVVAPGRRTGPATDSSGRLMTLDGCGKILKMDGGSVRRAWRIIVRENRGRREKDGSLWMSGDFILGEEEAKKKGCTTFFPTYVLKQLKDLSENVRKSFESAIIAKNEAENLVAADLQAARRFIFDQFENSIYQAHGVKIIREKQKVKKGTKGESEARTQRLRDVWLPSIEPILGKVGQPFLGCAMGGSVQTEKTSVQPLASAPETTATPHPAKPSTTALPMQSEYRERSLNKREASGRVEEPARPPAALSENGNGTDPRHHAIREALSRTLSPNCKRLRPTA